MGKSQPDSGERVGCGAPFEIYRNDPTLVPEDELRTDVYLPLE